MPGKKDRPQYVPQPLAVHAPVSQKERKDGPRFLPPLAESISSIRKVPAAHEVNVYTVFFTCLASGVFNSCNGYKQSRLQTILPKQAGRI